MESAEISLSPPVASFFSSSFFFFFSPNKHLLLIPLIRLAVGLLSPLYLWEQGGDAQGSDTTCIDWCEHARKHTLAHTGVGIPYSGWLCTALLQSHWFDSISPHKFLLSIHQYRTVHCDSQISRNSLPPCWERCDALSFAGVSECRSWKIALQPLLKSDWIETFMSTRSLRPHIGEKALKRT